MDRRAAPIKSKFKVGDIVRTTGGIGKIIGMTDRDMLIKWDLESNAWRYGSKAPSMPKAMAEPLYYSFDNDIDRETLMRDVEVIKEGSKLFQYAFFEEDIFKPAGKEEVQKRKENTPPPFCPNCDKNDMVHWETTHDVSFWHCERCDWVLDIYTEDIFKPADPLDRATRMEQTIEREKKAFRDSIVKCRHCKGGRLRLVGNDEYPYVVCNRCKGKFDYEWGDLYTFGEIHEDIFKPATRKDLKQRKDIEIDKAKENVVFLNIEDYLSYGYRDESGEFHSLGTIYSNRCRYPSQFNEDCIKVRCDVSVAEGNKKFKMGEIDKAKKWATRNVVAYLTNKYIAEDIFKPAGKKEILNRRMKEFRKVDTPYKTKREWYEGMSNIGEIESIGAFSYGKVPDLWIDLKYVYESPTTGHGGEAYAIALWRGEGGGDIIGVWSLGKYSDASEASDRLASIDVGRYIHSEIRKLHYGKELREDIFKPASKKEVEKRKQSPEAESDGYVECPYCGTHYNPDDGHDCWEYRMRDKDVDEDIFKPASKKEVGKRKEMEKEIKRKEEAERQAAYEKKLIALNKIPVKYTKKDEGSARGTKTVDFLGRRVDVAFTCDIEGGSPMTREDPGEPAYPMLMTIESAYDEDGNVVPITEALVEVVGDSIDIGDVDLPEPDYPEYWEDR
jgi:hypothetical protein